MEVPLALLFMVFFMLVFGDKIILCGYKKWLWILRSTGLRKKATITPVFSKDGKELHFHIDRIDPGETVEFKGVIELPRKKEKKK